jgi:hypothetical protein
MSDRISGYSETFHGFSYSFQPHAWIYFDLARDAKIFQKSRCDLKIPAARGVIWYKFHSGDTLVVVSDAMETWLPGFVTSGLGHWRFLLNPCQFTKPLPCYHSLCVIFSRWLPVTINPSRLYNGRMTKVSIQFVASYNATSDKTHRILSNVVVLLRTYCPGL